jgi:hypothetical protein
MGSVVHEGCNKISSRIVRKGHKGKGAQKDRECRAETFKPVLRIREVLKMYAPVENVAQN